MTAPTGRREISPMVESLVSGGRYVMRVQLLCNIAQTIGHKHHIDHVDITRGLVEGS